MRKLFLFFTAALLFTSCEFLQKKKETKDEETTEEKKDKKKKDSDDNNSDDKKSKNDSKIDDEDYKPQKKDANNDNTNSNTKTTDYQTTDRSNNSTNTSSMRTFNWDSYKMRFQVPSDFNVDENNAEKFNAGNGKLYLSIFPKSGQRVRESGLAPLLTSWARSQNVKYSGDANKMSNLNGYWGVYIDGTGSNGLPTSLLLLVDPDDPTISFYVWLQYQSQYLNTAVDILKSFKPI